MNRRDFLKVFAAAGLATAVPLNVLPQVGRQTLEPIKQSAVRVGKEYGQAIAFHGNKKTLALFHREAVDILVNDARQRLPSGTRFELRSIAPGDFGRRFAYAWYSRPEEFAQQLRWPVGFVGLDDAELVPEGGYFLIGRGVT